MDEKEIFLCKREKEVFDLIKNGYITDEDIAERLNISKHTVCCYVQRLYDLFNINGKQKRGKLVWEVMK